MTDKIPIELKPYTALQLMTFFEEFRKDMMKHEACKSLANCMKEFSDEVHLKITNEQIDDAVAERKINQSLGYEPTKKQ